VTGEELQAFRREFKRQNDEYYKVRSERTLDKRFGQMLCRVPLIIIFVYALVALL
jgi:hypothetical protein